MAKGTYTVGEGGETSSRDASYKSCLCALLIFIAICLIILLAGIKWSKDKPKEKDGEEGGELLGLKGEQQSTTTKVVHSVTRSTTKPTTTRRKLIIDGGITTQSTKTTSTTKATEKPPETKYTTRYSTATPSSTTTTTTTLIPLLLPVTKSDNKSTTVRTIIIPVTVTTQTEDDQTTTAYQYSTDNTTTSKPSNVKENATNTPNTTATTYSSEDESRWPYEDIEASTESSTVTTEGNENTESSTIETEGSGDAETSTITTEGSENETETTTQISTTTENMLNYRMLEVLEVTNDDATEEPSTGVTGTEAPTLMQGMVEKATTIVVRNQTTLTKLLPPTTTSTTTPPTPTTEADVGVIEDGQKIMDEYDYFEGLFDRTTASSTQIAEKGEITDEMRSWPKKWSTTTNSSPLFRKPEPVCLTVGCKSAASRMLSLMNHAVDPCENFYEFACGGMQVDNGDADTWKRLSEQLYLINNTDPSYLQTFKTFYDSCVSHEYAFDYQKRIAGVLELVKEVGGILDDEPPKGTLDMTDLFAKLILRQSLPIMDIDVDIDKQSSMFILKLTLPRPTSILKESGRWSALTEAQKRCLDEQRHELQQLNLDLTKIYDSYLTCQKNHAIYLNSIQTVVRALGFYSHLKDTYNQTQRIQDLRTTIEWDILEHLNTLPAPKEIRKQILFKDYTIQKISDLQVQYPFLQWKKLFNTLTGHTLANNTLIQVYFQPYFTELFQGLQTIPKWKINNALIAMYANNLYENLVIPQAKHSREDYCIKLSSNLFRDVSSNLYVKTWTPAEIKQSQLFLTNLFDVLKENLTSDVKEAEWLDDASRISVLLKLSKMSLTFNKQDDLYNNQTALTQKYSAVSLKSTDFQYNAVTVLKTESRMRYSLTGTLCTVDHLWSYFVNAYDSVPTSFYAKVLIMAPLGMIKQPVKGFPGYVTMARIGLSLAREIGRHFDPVGIQYGMTLSPESKPTYEALQTTMENESLFNITRIVGHQVATFMADPKLSVNERIADNTGLRLISEGFSSLQNESLLPWISPSFSREEIFFITAAQEYCQKIEMPEFMQQLFESEILPASLRVENIMTNSDHFADAFHCREGSAMNNNPIKTQFPHLVKVEDDYNYNYNLSN